MNWVRFHLASRKAVWKEGVYKQKKKKKKGKGNYFRLQYPTWEWADGWRKALWQIISSVLGEWKRLPHWC